MVRPDLLAGPPLRVAAVAAGLVLTAAAGSVPYRGRDLPALVLALPMAAFATALAWPWSSPALVVSLGLLTALAVAVLVIDWARMPRHADMVPVLAGLVLMGVVRLAAGAGFWPLVPGILLLLLWLGLYHTSRQLWLGVLVAVAVLAIPEGSDPQLLQHLLLGVLLGIFAVAMAAGQRQRDALGQLDEDIERATARLRQWAATRRGVLFKIDHEGFLGVEEDRDEEIG